MAHSSEGARIIPFPTAPPAMVPDQSQADRPKARHAIGDVLREERSTQERTLADVAESAAVSLPYLSEIERGRKEVSSDLLESVCGALEIDVAEVFERAARHLRLGSNSSPRMSLLAA